MTSPIGLDLLGWYALAVVGVRRVTCMAMVKPAAFGFTEAPILRTSAFVCPSHKICKDPSTVLEKGAQSLKLDFSRIRLAV